MFSLKNVRFKGIVRYPDIQIPQNCMTFICGESGYGKSTLLKLLNGVATPDFGEILYNGKPVNDYDPILLRREVLLCGQAAFLFDDSIEENFAQYYSYRDLPAIPPEQMHTFLKICAIDLPLDTPCTTMSGGERHRVFTAIHLSLQPKILLLDEPTGALDELTANTVLANIKTFCRENNITPIIVSHNQALIQSYADNTITLFGSERHG